MTKNMCSEIAKLTTRLDNTKKRKMTKLIGYVISLIGILLIVISLISSKIPVLSTLLSKIPQQYLLVAAAAVVIVGVAISLLGSKKSRKVTQSEEEVPIYEGEGKRKRIIGYKRASK